MANVYQLNQTHAQPILADVGTQDIASARKTIQAQPSQSFASAMNKAGHRQSAIPMLPQTASPLSDSAIAPQTATQRHFEQVLGDNLGIVNARALAQISDFMNSSGDSNMDIARNVISSRNIMATLSGQVVRSCDTTSGNTIRRAITPPPGASEFKPGPLPTKVSKAPAYAHQTVTGALSAKFESGTDGVAAIGYDKHGGTSYGKFQLSSKAGTMDQFIKFLRKESPEYAKRLAAAGPANTGGRSGAMPKEWKKIAEENPVLFESLQEKFIHASHYAPALSAINERTGLDPSQMSPALQEVLWSTAVQHGPSGAARIFSKAMDKIDASTADKPGTENFEKAMIENIYAMRSTQFSSSTERVQSAVQNRLEQERDLALAMLKHIV